MTTLCCFHAHPDDESIGTAGVMAQAAAEGHRVVLVVATRGEHGEVPEGFLGEGEALADRRVAETNASAELLGVARVVFLGYVDSGMVGEPTNDAPGSFWQADVDEAAGRLAAVLREEDVEVLTVYDDHGGYGHPDHVQVHRVGLRAAELAGTPKVFESTINRDGVRAMLAEAREQGLEMGAVDDPEVEVAELGTPEADINTCVDVSAFLGAKRASMRAHASQISEQSFFLALADDQFRRAFGTEWFLDRSRPARAPRRTSLFG